MEAFTPTPAATPPDVLRRILAGESDRYIDEQSDALAASLGGPTPERKGRWLHDAFSYVAEQDVVLAAYFDIEKETDWQVFGGSLGGNTIRIDGTRYYTYPLFRRGSRTFRDSPLD